VPDKMTSSSYTNPFRPPPPHDADHLRIYNTKIQNCTIVASQDWKRYTVNFLEDGPGIVHDGVLDQLAGFCFLSRNTPLRELREFRTHDDNDPTWLVWKLVVMRISTKTFMIVFDPNPPKED